LRENLRDVLSFLEREGLVNGRQLGLFGRSVGGTICSFFAKDPRVGAVVLASPPFMLTESFSKLYSAPHTGYVSLPETIQRSGQIKGEWKLNAGFFDELEALQEALVEAVDGATRVLVTQGSRDNKVAPESTRKLFELLSTPKDFLLFSEADHEYRGVEKEVTAAAIRWLRQHLLRKT
jgi:alpha-beta hydrolase superfamily lysophospholipase